MNILEEYKKQYELDKENENDELPENSKLDESLKEAYREKLNELRNDPNDIANAFKNMVNKMEKIDETSESENIMEEEVRPFIRHAYCTECGTELISKTPSMFNPYTLEKVCKHKCSKCGKVYNLEYAYPMVVYRTKDNKEILAYGL